MIWESAPWKRQLLRSARLLRRLGRKRVLRDRHLFVMEREVFLGCYVIRKLSDTVKISHSTRDMEFDVTRFPNLSPVTFWNRHHLDKAYDLDRGTDQSMKLRKFCNQVVHSFVFIVAEAEEGESAGIFISSDRSRNKELFLVRLTSIVAAFERVGRDCPPNIAWRKDEGGEERAIVS